MVVTYAICGFSHYKDRSDLFMMGLEPSIELLLMEEILHQLRLVVYPIIYDGLFTSQVVIAGISEPSAVSPVV